MSTKAQPANAKAFLQELRSNRKTQGMLVVFIAVLCWIFWPEQKKVRPRPGSGVAAASASSALLGDQQKKSLDNLPDLGKAAGAGELPKSAEMARDLFLFDAPARIPKVVFRPVEPPPPPTEEQLAAAKEKAARELESASRPTGVRFLGFLSTKQQGRLGAFMKGEDPLTLAMGDLSFRGWKLVKLDETGAEFQNLRFPDMRHKIQPTDASGPGGPTNVRNEF